MKHRVYKVG